MSSDIDIKNSSIPSDIALLAASTRPADAIEVIPMIIKTVIIPVRSLFMWTTNV